MRKLMIVAAVLALPLIGQARDSADGCGLGWEITDKMTFLATTTRQITNAFVPPTFGMTTGTLGCTQLSIASNEREAVNYVAQNYSSLKQELAAGQGEYANALVEVMGCGSASSLSTIKSKYNEVVAPAQNGIELYQNLKAEMCS